MKDFDEKSIIMMENERKRVKFILFICFLGLLASVWLMCLHYAYVNEDRSIAPTVVFAILAITCSVIGIRQFLKLINQKEDDAERMCDENRLIIQKKTYTTPRPGICASCHDEFEKDLIVECSGCNHVFHEECFIENSLDESTIPLERRKCPACNNELETVTQYCYTTDADAKI